MNLEIKITKDFLNQIKSDLYRPHEFAYERVGFVYCKPTLGSWVASKYQPIADEKYIKDPYVGAKFSGDEIRIAMQRSLKSKEGVFHIHIHEHAGEPHLSAVDIRSVTEIATALSNVNSSAHHGCILLSEDWCKAYVLNPVTKKLELIKTKVIRFPLTFFYPRGEFL